MAFDYSLNYAALNLRKNPLLYRVGKGEQEILMVEPYKSEILPHWRFKTPEIAAVSAQADPMYHDLKIGWKILFG